MNALLVETASSWGVSASGMRLTAPTVPWMVSSSVRPVKTRIVSCFSPAVSVPHDGMSLDTGTFSGSQKLPVSRSQTSASFSSCRRFQLIAETRSISLSLSLTRTPLRVPAFRLSTLPLGCDNAGEHNIVCPRVGLFRTSRARLITRFAEEAVFAPVQLASGQPILPGVAAPQHPVLALRVEIPAAASAGVPHRVRELLLQVVIEPVLCGARRG